MSNVHNHFYLVYSRDDVNVLSMVIGQYPFDHLDAPATCLLQVQGSRTAFTPAGEASILCTAPLEHEAMSLPQMDYND